MLFEQSKELLTNNFQVFCLLFNNKEEKLLPFLRFLLFLHVERPETEIYAFITFSFFRSALEAKEYFLKREFMVAVTFPFSFPNRCIQ